MRPILVDPKYVLFIPEDEYKGAAFALDERCCCDTAPLLKVYELLPMPRLLWLPPESRLMSNRLDSENVGKAEEMPECEVL